MSADCNEKQFDFFTTLVLDFSLYLGFTLLTIMIAVGIYFFLKYCCCKRCRKRHAFSGIRSQPSFVATIQFAFSSNLTTFTEIVSRDSAGGDNKVELLCTSCGHNQEKRPQTSGQYCDNCGTNLA